jgi:hypothetical protein
MAFLNDSSRESSEKGSGTIMGIKLRLTANDNVLETIAGVPAGTAAKLRELEITFQPRLYSILFADGLGNYIGKPGEDTQGGIATDLNEVFLDIAPRPEYTFNRAWSRRPDDSR